MSPWSDAASIVERLSRKPGLSPEQAVAVAYYGMAVRDGCLAPMTDPELEVRRLAAVARIRTAMLHMLKTDTPEVS
ncbi:MAG: hypothetical protein GEU80_09200 [Dehalococcoidia bacterium]|nr:hypothetical protein [Dehalococcoidia bacterium]